MVTHTIITLYSAYWLRSSGWTFYYAFRDKVVDFHWNASDPWTIVSVSDDCGSTGGGGTLQVNTSFCHFLGKDFLSIADCSISGVEFYQLLLYSLGYCIKYWASDFLCFSDIDLNIVKKQSCNKTKSRDM